MNEIAKKALAKVNMSLLIQFACQPESEALLVNGLKESLPFLKNIPVNMVRYACFVIPDRPVTALGEQKISLRKLVDWYFTEKGGLAFRPASSEEGGKSAKAIRRVSQAVREAEKDRAHDVMGRGKRMVAREAATAQVAYKYYVVTRDRHKQMAKDDNVDPDTVQKQYQQLLGEAENFSGKLDRLGWATMLFASNAQVIEQAQLVDITEYKEACREIFDEDIFSAKKTARIAVPSMG